jgi:hypothetical protein
MSIRTLPAVAGLLLLAGTGMAAADTVILSPEQSTAVREYIVTQKVQPIEPPPGVEISVGTTLPDTVEVHSYEVPNVTTKYDYVVVGKQTVVVEPGTRKIIQVID